MEAAVLDKRTAPLTGVQVLILVTAGVGFAFDMYEVVVQAIIVRPMLMELGPFQPGTPEFNHWTGLMLFLPTVAGGLTALLGGYLTDRLGRQRVLVWSIVLYGAAAFMSAFATSIPELILWRCITVAGACVEFVAAIAWLTELFPEAKRREAVLGFAQVCATGGNFMIAGAYYAAVTWGDLAPAIHGGHSAWRYALLFGALPAIPLILVRPFLPESPAWREKRAAGTLKRPRFGELFEPRLRRVTLITTGLVACCYALAFGMLQHIPRIVPGLPQIAALPRQQQEQWVTWVHVHVDTGALIGRLVLTGLVVWLVARRPMLRGMLWAGLALYPLVFFGPALHDAEVFKYAVLAVTLVVGIQYSFWGNYLPRVFPLHLRGTGESFAISIGARVLAPFTVLATTQLSNVMPGANPTLKLAHSMAVVAVAVTACALILSRWLPEPGAEPPEE
ncbi:MAG TPA: MFS transporter [Steroidobacteraceae bacterium]|nr:MFS transporter [Steroidobacteraceae bacterium]